MSTNSKRDRFSKLGIRKNERPEEVPAAALVESTDVRENINTENDIPNKITTDENITTESNIKKNKQNPDEENINNELRGRKKSNKAAFKSVTFNVEQNLHRDFKIMAANLGISMVDMLDEALRIYMNIRSRKNLHQEFENGKTVTDIVFKVLPENNNNENHSFTRGADYYGNK